MGRYVDSGIVGALLSEGTIKAKPRSGQTQKSGFLPGTPPAQGNRMKSDSILPLSLPSFPRRRESRPPSSVPISIMLTVHGQFDQIAARAIALPSG